jgi:putative membrane-bound dehydrogenase-like protein
MQQGASRSAKSQTLWQEGRGRWLGRVRFCRGKRKTGGHRGLLLGLWSGLMIMIFPGLVWGQNAGSGRPADKHDPANAVANLDIYPGLSATLFASEPVLTNPTNIDIDARGRVWVCDVMNYRGHNGLRPAGDRILILEDTDGDGKMDRVKVFYQGRDVDSAMGICVLGNRVIVSCSPNILVFTFDEQDRILKKEVLFTRTGIPQHDHSAHTFVFGPDGRLYWNFGNTGQSVHDKYGKPVVDRAGNVVQDGGRPYWGGMVFRCQEDGSDFEVLAHNFRNNYEVAVDSFGTLWQSDNDDDGNRGVRINYVMEFGNYGYRGELTGAGWNTPRTNLEQDIPHRHWHQNDPGVVPNLLLTGAGSPTGICVNEGDLLPRIFYRQLIHCDAGPSIVRCYRLAKDGAGYRVTDIVPLLDGSRKNNWFRPVDPRLAPDGSLFVSDWYDPGVGGHAQGDSNRGRIFRVAPPGCRYRVPHFDFTTPEGAAEALKNPCSAVRYLAWKTLRQMDQKAESALLVLWRSDNPCYRARALWLLGRLRGKGEHYVLQALRDADADIRIVGVRLARQLQLELPPLLRQVIRDPDPAVRRECAIALRHCRSPEAPALWAELASQHDGRDRWYLEALGIGADRQWDAFLEAFLKRSNSSSEPTTPAWRDIIWRSRARQTPGLLARLIADPATPAAELPRLFRAFDFQTPGPEKEKALLSLLQSPARPETQRARIAVEVFKRLERRHLAEHPECRPVLALALRQIAGTEEYVELVRRLQLVEQAADLLALAQQHAAGQLGVTALRALFDLHQEEVVRQALAARDAKRVQATLQVLTTAADDRSRPLLLSVIQDPQREPELRRQAVRALSRLHSGARLLLDLAEKKQLPEELRPVAGLVLTQAPWPAVRAAAARLFPLPPSKDNQPLPSLRELARRRGNPANGRKVFFGVGTCSTCHRVHGEGKDVGPDLSEIGNKLSREALFEAILYPSAGIDHNYETWVAELKNGGVVTGILVSQTPDSISLKGVDAIVRTFSRKEIESLSKSPVSLMPADLARVLTVQELTDVVEYLLSLRGSPAASRTGK